MQYWSLIIVKTFDIFLTYYDRKIKIMFIDIIIKFILLATI